MKKRVRIYKAEDGNGRVVNPLSNFISKAQQGMQQDGAQQQLIMQVVSMLAPVEAGGQGQDPQQVYQMIANQYGPEVANQLITIASQYLKQYNTDSQTASANQTDQENTSPELAAQEELFEAERQRQAAMQDQQYMADDDEFMDDLLYAKDGGQLDKLKKKFVKSTVKLAKKQLGDAVKNENTKADSTDILDGRNKITSDFLNSVKNNVTLSTIEKQAQSMADNYFAQIGGAVNPDLYKYIYGGYDPSIPELTKAQSGITVTDKYGNTKQVTQEEADYWDEQITSNPELRLTDLSFASEAQSNNDLTSRQNAFMSAGRMMPNQNYYVNPVPYFSNNIMDALLPFNRGRWKNIMGQPMYAGTNLPFTGNMFGKDVTGMSYTKERLGPGAKKITVRPVFDQQANTADDLEKEKRGLFNRRDNERQGPFSNLGEKLKYRFTPSGSENDGIRGARIKSGFSKLFRNPEKRAAYGLETYQGNVNGSSVNTQTNDIPELKPLSPQEAWAKAYPEIRNDWGLGPDPSDKLQQDWEATMFSMKEFDPENWLMGTNLIGNKTAQIAEQLSGRKARAEQDAAGRTSDAFTPLNLYTDPGTYDINAQKVLYPGMKPGAPYSEGYEGVMGRGIQAKYGGNIMAHGGTAYPQRFGSLAINPTAMGGNDIDQYTGKKDIEVKASLGPIARKDANLEAEGGETAYGDINGDGFPEHYKITGPRHSEGGVPLNLPDGTFIFSDTRSMKITDCNVLKMFNKPCGKGGFTPATLAKPYDINKYRKILQDPESDVLDKKTAELMIKQSVLKLGALALAQESKKGFPQGIPEVARPYMEAMGIEDEHLLPKEQMQGQGTPQEMDMMAMTSEEGMPPVDQMAMEQEDMSGAPMRRGGQYKSLKKAAQGMTKEPCPEGMVWDPVYGCVPLMDQHMQNYTPEQIQNYFNKIRKQDAPLIDLYDNIIRENPDYFTQPVDDYMLQRYKDNYIPIIDTETGKGFVDYMNLTPDQIRQKKTVDMNYLGDYMNLYNRAGYPPDEWLEQLLHQNDPNKLQNERNLEKEIEFNKQLYDYQNNYEQNMQDCPCRKKQLKPDGTMSQICVPCEQMPMAAYGMELGGYDIPFAQNTFARGGQLDRYQSKGEVKTSPKVYREEDLPADAIIRSEKDAWNLKDGDFILQSDGTYRKVTNVKFDPRKVAVDTGTQKQSVQEFMAQSSENAQLIEQANAIIKRGIDNGTIKCINSSCSEIRILGTFKPDFKDRIIISRALNSNRDFGTDKYKVKKQSYTPGYEGKGAFVAGFEPEDYEKRYIFEKARGAGNTDEEAYAIVEQVYADPALKAKFRREYTNMLGMTNVPASDEELLKPDFYKTRYADVTKGMENVLSKDFARPSIGDDALAGFEHFDAFGFSPAIRYEGEPTTPQKTDQIDVTDPSLGTPINIPVPEYAPWWLQDTIGMAGAFNRMYSREDEYPKGTFVDYEEAYGPMLNPDREIASGKEDADMALNYLASFAGQQGLMGAYSGIQGKTAKNAADILSRYNDANVQLARQDIRENRDIRNMERKERRAAWDLLKRETDLLKQKKQNTKLADKKYIEDSLKSAITNRMKTAAVNSLFPEYSVDPSVGGWVYRTDSTRTPQPTRPDDLNTIAMKYKEAGWAEAEAAKLALAEYNRKQSAAGLTANNMYPVEALMSLYNYRQGGTLPTAQTGLTKYAPQALRSFLGLVPAANEVSQFVQPLGSQSLMNIDDIQNLASMYDYQDMIQSTDPVLSQGFNSNSLKNLWQNYNKLTDKGIEYLSKLPGARELGTLSKYLTPIRPSLESNILETTGFGSVKPESITDEALYLLARKKQANIPLDINEEVVLIKYKDKVEKLLAKPPKYNKDKLSEVLAPIEQSKPMDNLKAEQLDAIAMDYFKRPYEDLTVHEKLFIEGERARYEAALVEQKAGKKSTKKTTAEKKTVSRRKKPVAPESAAPDMTELYNKISMENYGEAYEDLPSIAKGMVEAEAKRIAGSFRDGGAYVMGSNVFPFMFY